MNLPSPGACNPLQEGPRRVVVTGYGVVSALGNDMDTLWKSIMSYQVGYRKVEFSDKKIISKFFGMIDDKPSLEKYPKALLKFVPEFGRYGLVAADQAIAMAFGSDQVFRDSYEPFDRGVVFGTGWGALDQSGVEYSSYARTKWASPFANLIVMPNVATAAISIAWGLKGYQNTPIAACATGSLAVGDAYEVIRSGRAKVMLAGGGESIREEFSVWTVDVLRALSKEQESAALACCPFSRARSGFVMSEGAAVLCLEGLEYAQARGAKILGEIVGFATYSDAADMTASGADISARTKTIKDALARAGIDGSHLGYINAHGTSTPLNDISETRALKEALGDWAYKIPTSSTKSYTGHLIAATGSLESALCLRTMETGIAPATIHLTDPDPECDLDYVANVHRQIAPPQYALNVNYGFGGINTALVFRKYE